MNDKLTYEEALDTLTDADENAILAHFNIDIYAGAMARPGKATRGVAFIIHHRQAGLSLAEAAKAIKDMPMGQVNDLFASDEDEVDEDEPDTEPGKDDSQPESKPSGSLSSASTPE